MSVTKTWDTGGGSGEGGSAGKSSERLQKVRACWHLCHATSGLGKSEWVVQNGGTDVLAG